MHVLALYNKTQAILAYLYYQTNILLRLSLSIQKDRIGSNMAARGFSVGLAAAVFLFVVLFASPAQCKRVDYNLCWSLHAIYAMCIYEFDLQVVEGYLIRSEVQ